MLVGSDCFCLLDGTELGTQLGTSVPLTLFFDGEFVGEADGDVGIVVGDTVRRGVGR